MKNFLLKPLSVFVLIIAFGCSEEQTVSSNEEATNNLNFIEAQKTASNQARRKPNHTIIVSCPGVGNGVFGPFECPQGLDPSITIYNVYQSPTCPGIFMVWVDSAEYHAVYQAATTGTRHVLMPPFEDEPQAVPRNHYDYCFN